MKVFFGVLLLVAAALAEVKVVESQVTVEDLTAFDYHNKVGINRAQEIKTSEAQVGNDANRIVGGSAAALGHAPYQVGTYRNLCRIIYILGYVRRN